MKKEQGFTLIELLIVVAIIAIIAAIAVPNLITARKAASESAAIAGLRTLGSAQAAYMSTNGQFATGITALVSGGYVDSRYNGTSVNGYKYTLGAVSGTTEGFSGVNGFVASPDGTGNGRYTYGIGQDMVIRYMTGTPVPLCGSNPCSGGDPIGLGK